MCSVKYQTVDDNEDGQRLDNYLIKILKGVPKSHIYRIIRAGEVRINKKRVKPSNHLVKGDVVRIPPVRTCQSKSIVVKEDLKELIKKSIISEDDNLLVINKPAKLAVHGGSGISLGVIELLRQIRKDLRYIELVHRLDRDTSGCLLIAKKRSFLRKIQDLLVKQQVKKTYWALASGNWQNLNKISVNEPLKKNILKSGERFVVIDSQGKKSLTNFNLLENYQDSCWVEASPKTGRTHQIRVHSAYLKHPILGDTKYGNPEYKNPGKDLEKKRLYLHARQIEFTLDGRKYYFMAELDLKFHEMLEKLRFNS